MTRVKTYVFIDLETTGLPKEEYNKTRITELSMVAVKRQHVLETRAGAVPRVQHKLTLCFNPLRRVSEEGTKITGLCNDLLENEPVFNLDVFTMIDTFLSVLTQPVCLIAQNGNNFDFPIFKNHVVKLNVNFKADVLCADCYHGFYHILMNKKLFKNVSNDKCNTGSKEDSKEVENSTIISTVLSSTSNEISANPSSTKQTGIDEIDYQLSMQAVNETTPKVTKNATKNPGKVNKARKQLFPWGDGPKPNESYKLKDIYERVLNKQAVDAHRAENDCMFALEISAALTKEFVEWVDNNHFKFSDVVPMTIGVPM